MLIQSDPNLSDAEFAELTDLVYRHCGINLHDGKKELVRARLAKQMRLGGFNTATQYMRHVMADPTGEEFRTLIDALSTNLTSFFRESSHFDYLKKTFLPRIMEEKRKRGAMRIRAWSAGCSSGEEPYTLAMVLQEATGGGADAGWDIKLLATDISTRVLEIAQRGAYEKSRVNEIPPEFRSRYFSSNRYEGRVFFEALPVLRQMICFRHLNLMEEWPFNGPFDFIFCRNVMIYFDKPTQQRLVGRYHAILQSGGLLFTGHSESLTGIAHNFKYVQPTIYAKA